VLQLKLNGKLFGGWTEASITRGIAQAVSTFDLKVTDRWDNKQWAVAPFDDCQILWNGSPIITGYIDTNAISYDAESHQISITGRSKTADLVDCSVASAQFKNQNFQQIVQALCKPFGIDVVAQVSTGSAFLSWKAEEGMPVFEAIENLARLRGLLLTDNGSGNLVITQASTTRISTPLELGVNIKSGSGRFDVRDRFSDYIIKGQQKGGDEISPEFAAHVSATVKDTNVKRYRPLILQAEDQTDIATAQKRARWESNVRFGLSQVFGYTVQGFEHANGLWQPNTLVHVKDKYLGLDTDLLITSVTNLLSNSGTETYLTLGHPRAFIPEPIATPVKSKNSVTKKKPATGPQWDELNP